MDDGQQMAADAEGSEPADEAAMDAPIQIFKATCIKGPNLKQPWLPDVQSVSGVDYIKLGKWDRDLTLFATGTPLNFAATRKRPSHNINVIWFEDMKKVRQEACDSAVKKVIVEAAEAEGKPVPKRIRPAREDDQFLIGKTVMLDCPEVRNKEDEAQDEPPSSSLEGLGFKVYKVFL